MNQKEELSMSTKGFFKLLLLLSIAGLIFSGCERMREASPTATETTGNQLLKNPLLTNPDIIVNTTSDAADFAGAQQVGDLPGPDGLVSLREAIIAANNTTGSNVIGFNIPQTDAGFDGKVFIIKPLSPLPELGDNGTAIDGRTQTLFTGETNILGPEIVLDGSQAGNTPGIAIGRSDNHSIFNLVIYNFAYTGIQFNEDETYTHPMNVRIAGCYIGTDASGSIAVGNGWEGIAENGTNNVIGGRKPSEGNLIAGNNLQEVQIDGSGTVVQQNIIGTDRTSTIPLGHVTGLRIGANWASKDVIVKRNIISGNDGNGVSVETSNSVRITISENQIFSNSGLGIDLNSDGVTPNDPGDSDIGPNNLMNYPVISSASVTTGKLLVMGSIDTQNPHDVIIEFFANPLPNPGGDPSGYGEGAIYLGSVRPNPQGKFTSTLPTVVPGTIITATATDADGNTSEFSADIVASVSGK